MKAVSLLAYSRAGNCVTIVAPTDQWCTGLAVCLKHGNRETTILLAKRKGAR